MGCIGCPDLSIRLGDEFTGDHCPDCGGYVSPNTNYFCQNCHAYTFHSTPDAGSFVFGGLVGLTFGWLVFTEFGKRAAAAAVGIGRDELERRIAQFESRRR